MPGKRAEKREDCNTEFERCFNRFGFCQTERIGTWSSWQTRHHRQALAARSNKIRSQMKRWTQGADGYLQIPADVKYGACRNNRFRQQASSQQSAVSSEIRLSRQWRPLPSGLRQLIQGSNTYRVCYATAPVYNDKSLLIQCYETLFTTFHV